MTKSGLNKAADYNVYASKSHPIAGFKDDGACVTTKTADRITEDG